MPLAPGPTWTLGSPGTLSAILSAALPWLVTWISTPTPEGTETTGGEMSPEALAVMLASTCAPWEAACVPAWCFCFLAVGTSGGALVLVVVVVATPLTDPVMVRTPALDWVAGVCDDAAGVAEARLVELCDEPPHAARPRHVTIATSVGHSLIAPSIERWAGPAGPEPPSCVAVTIAILTTYLSDYRLPLYRLLAERHDIEVLCYGGGERYAPAWFADLDAQLVAADFPARRLRGRREALTLGRRYDAVIAPFAGGALLPAAYAGTPVIRLPKGPAIAINESADGRNVPGYFRTAFAASRMAMP